jgi:hypothetical protein
MDMITDNVHVMYTRIIELRDRFEELNELSKLKERRDLKEQRSFNLVSSIYYDSYSLDCYMHNLISCFWL